MSYTLHSSPGLKCWESDLANPFSSASLPKLSRRLVRNPCLSYRHEKFTLDDGESRTIEPALFAAAEWYYLAALVTGDARITTVGLDTDDTTPINGYTHVYGTSYLPGLGMIQTYNISSATITAMADDTTIELICGIIAVSTDSRL